MSRRLTYLFALFTIAAFMGCDSRNSGAYQEPPVNTGEGNVNEDVARDAGVATDDSVMSQGATEK